MQQDYIKHLLQTLTTREREILSYKCGDNKPLMNKEIAKECKISEKAVEYHLANIYAKLGLDQMASRTQRKNWLLIYICPYLLEMLANEAKGDTDGEPNGELDGQPKGSQNDDSSGTARDSDPRDIILINPRAINLVKEDNKSQKTDVIIDFVPHRLPPPASPSGSSARGKWQTILAFLAGVLFTLIVLVGGFFLYQYLMHNPLPMIPIPSILRTATTQNTSTVPISPTIQPQPVISTFTFQPTLTQTFTSTSTIIPTSTITVTPSLTITPSPTLTSTITPDILLFDDFENGYSPLWTIHSGQVFVGGGVLTVNDPVWMEAGDPTWKNIKVELKIKLPYNADCSGSITQEGYYRPMWLGLRYQDTKNMLALKMGTCGFLWFVVSKDNWVKVPPQGAGAGEYVYRIVTVTVENNKFTAYIDNTQVTDYFDNTYSTGKFAIRMDKDTTVDYIKITRLP